MALDREYWSQSEEVLVADLMAQGYSKEQATVMVRSVHNALGLITDEQAHAGGSMKVTRVQAPWLVPGDPSTDPSPDSLAAAEEQNK